MQVPLKMTEKALEIGRFQYQLRDQDLPSNYVYRIQDFDSIAEEYVIRANVKSFSQIDEWIYEFSRNSKTQWIFRHSHPNGTRRIWKEVLCHHSSFGKVEPTKNLRGLSKNANCGARIRIIIQMLSRRNRNTEFMKANLWATIRISRNHTHSLYSTQALRFLQDRAFKKNTDANLRQTFCEYFSDNMNASEAKNHHKRLLELRNASKEELSNGRLNPTSDTINYWYNDWRGSNLEPRTEPQIISKLKEKKNIYVKRGVTIDYEEEPLCICVITPIMRRAHSLPFAAEHLFIDTTSSCDPGNYSVTFLLSSCPAGSIPLGLIITKGQTTEAYTNGFKLFRRITSKFAFRKRGYPTTILTDNSAAEIAAIEATWPESTHFLSIFHILQTIWRWLFNSDNKIHQRDRTTLMGDFKAVLKAQNFEEMESAYSACIRNGTKYPRWLKYLDDYWKFKEKWCLAYRDEKIRDHHTNNYSEADIRIFKEVVFTGLKPNNVISLVDFCAVGLEEYHVNKLRDFAHFSNRRAYIFFQKRLKKIDYLTKNDITLLSDCLFLVPSETKSNNTRTVDCEIGVCSCYEGRHGKFCKHQCSVFQFFDHPFVNFPMISASDRHIMATVALGKKKTPDVSFYDDFIVEMSPNQEIAKSHKVETVSLEEKNTPDVSIYDDFILEMSPDREIVESIPDVIETVIVESVEIDDSDANFTNDHDNIITDPIIEGKKEVNRMLQIFEKKLVKYGNTVECISAMKQFTERLNAISNSESLIEFLNSAGSKRFKSGANIAIRPTTFSERKRAIMRGYRRIAAGRIVKGSS